MNVANRFSKTPDLSYLLVSLFVFLYVLIRAIRIDITFDEAWTILDFVPLDYFHIFNFNPPGTNNHILNTLLIKFLYSILPDTVFVARLSNLIAFILYLIYARKLCKRYLKDWLGLMLFLALVLNPFALDFFGLARGYGLLLGFQMAALYHILRYFEEKRTANLIKLSLFCLFMILSNMATLYFYLGWLGVYAADLLIRREKFSTRTGIVLFFSGLIMAVVWVPIRKLIEVRGFYQGGADGFYQDTIWSLLRYSMGSMERSAGNRLACNAVCLVLLVCLLLGLFAKGKDKPRIFVVFGILSIAALATIVQHFLLDGFYLLDRTALFFYPLMVLILFFSIGNFDHKIFSAVFSIVITIVLAFNFISNANFYKNTLNYFESHATEIYSYINKQGERHGKKQKVDYCWPFERSMAYYLKRGKYPYLEDGRKSFYSINDSCDFYLYLGGRLDVVKYDPETQLIVLDPRKKDTVLAFPEEKVFVLRIRTDNGR